MRTRQIPWLGFYWLEGFDGGGHCKTVSVRALSGPSSNEEEVSSTHWSPLQWCAATVAGSAHPRSGLDGPRLPLACIRFGAQRLSAPVPPACRPAQRGIPICTVCGAYHTPRRQRTPLAAPPILRKCALTIVPTTEAPAPLPALPYLYNQPPVCLSFLYLPVHE